jgi:hypothetical protein
MPLKIQTPRQFYTNIYTQLPSDLLLKLLTLNGISVPKEEILQTIQNSPGGYEQSVRGLFVKKMLSVPLREAPIRYSWPHEARGLNRRQYIPARTTNDLVVKPRIDHDRWIVDCPYCPGAEMAMDKFFCTSCLNTGIYPHGPTEYTGEVPVVGTRWIKVEWPSGAERYQREDEYDGGVE